MGPIDLNGQRILVTQSDEFMGPALCETLRECGADVVADPRPMTDPDAPAAAVAAAGRLDAVIANLALPAATSAVLDADEDEWREAFRCMVDPLPRLVRAVLPQMIERRAGRIVLMGSASALRGMKRTSTYRAARGAQLAYVQAVGIEVAPHNVQVNAIAQNFVDNPTYFPTSLQANPKFQERLKREVPLGRLVAAREDALFAAMLCSPDIGCFVGQVFPVCGGWVPR